MRFLKRYQMTKTIEAMQELENGGGTVFEGTAHDFISAMLEG